MKKDIHPTNYRQVIFLDNTSGEQFLIASAVPTKETAKFTDGKEYPLFRVEISSASHPFYTGKQTVVDTAGRVQKFTARRLASADIKANTKVKTPRVKKPKVSKEIKKK